METHMEFGAKESRLPKGLRVAYRRPRGMVIASTSYRERPDGTGINPMPIAAMEALGTRLWTVNGYTYTTWKREVF